MKVPLLDLKAQYVGMREEIRAAMDDVCDSQYFILGPKVEAFERQMADYCGASHAVGVSSGSDALLAALMALDVGPGDGVITTPYTFFATVGAIVRVGATPLFADIDPVTFNIDPTAVRALLEDPPERFAGITPKVLMPVHLYGQVADMDPLLALAQEFDLKVVEDAAQAIGAQYPGREAPRSAGSMGDFGCFSFFPSKNLGGFGDGGLVVAQDEALAERLRLLRNHGSQPKYYHPFVGGNFRLDALQAVVLEIKRRHLESWHTARRANAAFYDDAFAGTNVATPTAIYRESGVPNYHIYNQYVVRVSERDHVREHLLANEVGCEIYYPVPLHMQACFEGLGYKQGAFPESERAANETLALPIYPELTREMQSAVVSAVLGA